MAKKEFQKEDEQLQNVENTVSAATLWFEKNSKLISWIICAVIVVVLAVMAVNKYIIQPKKAEASQENAKAVAYFMQGDWQKALNGDEADCIGFAEIADKYSLYQQGELAALYAGICNYKLGNYEDAANYLKQFSADDLVIDPSAKMLLGDAYVEMGELKKAASSFMAAAASKNEIIAPIALKKAGNVYMALDDKKAAHNVYVTIRDEYPQSSEASDIEKYIALTK